MIDWEAVLATFIIIVAVLILGLLFAAGFGLLPKGAVW